MTNTKIAVQIVNQHGVHLGYVHLSGWLPTFLVVDGAIYQRYGQVGSYRYILETDVYKPTADGVTINR